MIPTQLKKLCDKFFDDNAHDFDMATNEGCGEYMELLVPFCQAHSFAEVGHLRKNPSQTQYNGHANDAIAYDLGNNLTHAVDCIANAEQPHPWVSEGGTNPDPAKNFGEDTINAYKTDTDWLEKPNDEGGEHDMTVPYVPYDEKGFQRLKNMLAHDYARRPQGADFDVSIWAGRYFHNCYMGPEGIPLGEQAALERIKPELCAALGIPVDNYYGT
jgi:hypothetical protein